MRATRFLVPVVALLCLSACGTASSTADLQPGAGTKSPGTERAEGRPGPHGPNNHGLCTAYFAGSAQGRADKHSAPPFMALEKAAESAGQNVTSWCDANGSRPGNDKEKEKEKDKPRPSDR